MVDLARGLDGWAQPTTGHRWGWAAFVMGLRALFDHAHTNTRRVDEAHERLRLSRVVSQETMSDVGLNRDDILGEPTWQADLPFFMQRDFR